MNIKNPDALRARILRNISYEFADGLEPLDKSPCWIWQRRTSGNGYGVVTIRDGRKHPVPYYVHRLAFHLFARPLRAGFEIDHKCNNRACCNPEHLREVRRSTNALHREARKRGPIDWARYFKDRTVVNRLA